MNRCHLPLTFSVDPDTPLDTLEMVLSIARRISLRLVHMQVRGHAVFLELQADSDDPLALFSARLHNAIGVHDIVLNVCMLPIRQKYRTLRALTNVHNERDPCRTNPPSAPPLQP